VKALTIAIDGPAAAGKSTLGYHLAQSLNYLYVDTGVLYRAVTWAALEQTIPIADEQQVTALSQRLAIDIAMPTEDDGRQCTVYVEERDITWELRAPAVDGSVSQVAAYPGVRQALTQRMREMAQPGRIVMVGRDIGTVVLPHADLKLYIIATAEERARRRVLDLTAQGKHITYEEVLANIRQRDRIDSNRAVAPLQAAEDAVILDTTYLSKQKMFQEAMALACCRRKVCHTPDVRCSEVP
jgi:CMP/dCMP kinase